MSSLPHNVQTPTGEAWPALGLGTWQLGESRSRRAAEVGALREAFEVGYRLLDTAEMYGDGGAEEVLGEALAGALRDGLSRRQFVVVSKVYPHNASRAGVVRACERSLRRLRLESIDLYLLHWRGGEPLAETVAGFQTLQQRGLIRHWGVSNFDVADLQDLDTWSRDSACNQVYFSLGARGPELALLPWQRERRMPLMAYSPIDQGALARHAALQTIARRHSATAAQVALAWVLSRGADVVPIPGTRRRARLEENLGALGVALTAEDLAALEPLAGQVAGERYSPELMKAVER